MVLKVFPSLNKTSKLTLGDQNFTNLRFVQVNKWTIYSRVKIRGGKSNQEVE